MLECFAYIVTTMRIRKNNKEERTNPKYEIGEKQEERRRKKEDGRKRR